MDQVGFRVATVQKYASYVPLRELQYHTSIEERLYYV